MKQLYTPGEAQRWQRRASLSLAFCIGLPVLALAVCIALCTQVTTASAQTLLLTVIALFTLAGWAAILLAAFAYIPAKALAVHIGGMLADEPQLYEGVLTLLPETFGIPGSITVRKASILTEDGPVSLSVSTGLVRQLPEGSAPVRVWTVRKFITAYEVIA